MDDSDERDESSLPAAAREESQGQQERRRFSLGALGARLAAVATGVGEAIVRTAEAAGELITDSDLRKRGAQAVADGAGKAALAVGAVAQAGAAGIGKGFQAVGQGPRQIQGVLQRLQARVEEQRMRVLLQEQRDAPVDVQVGQTLYEDAPQELRSRLWMAVLEHPELVASYQALISAPAPTPRAGGGGEPAAEGVAEGEAATAGEGQRRQAEDGGMEAEDGQDAKGAEQEEGAPAAAPAPEPPSVPAAEDAAEPDVEGDGPDSAAEDSQPAAPEAEPSGAASDGSGVTADIDDVAGSEGEAASARPSGDEDGQEAVSMEGSPGGSGLPGGQRPAAPPSAGGSSQGPEGGSRRRSSGSEEGWEVLQDRGPTRRPQGAPLLAGGARMQRWDAAGDAFRNELMSCMMAVPWPLPVEVPDDCRYATLLQISVGQEDVDEVITRDIHRTFPEYPLFGLEQGQRALFRVLKAYSLHDLEVGYCQGMAFVAGVLLFYAAEEPAFQIFCRLLATHGPNLRRLYLPGLEGLKAELRRLDLLMATHLPNLKAHLESHGVVPVLYASQWLLTAYSCPFPLGFACRLVDVMLLENSDAVLTRAAMAVLAECEADLLMQDDFEELLTYLKVEPAQWPQHRLRRVLDAAIHSPIGAAELAEVAAACDVDRSGSLSRQGSSYDAEAAASLSAAEAEAEAPLLPAIATAAERAVAHRRPHGSGHSLQAAPGAGPGSPGRRGGGADGPGGELDAELAKHAAELDDEMMRMVLELEQGGDTQDPYAALHAAEPSQDVAPRNQSPRRA